MESDSTASCEEVSRSEKRLSPLVRSTDIPAVLSRAVDVS